MTKQNPIVTDLIARFGGIGWFVFHPRPRATTEICHVAENGDIYIPDGSTNVDEFLEAASRNDYSAYRLVRAPDLDKALQAIIHTVEYVGWKTLPPIVGWSWYDILLEFRPEDAKRFKAAYGDRQHDKESNLVQHARVELELLGEEPETIEGYLKIVQAFADMGHSGGSASVAIPTLEKLLRFENLKPITSNPEEWYFHEPEVWDGVYGVWQNKRNGTLFSTDGGLTYSPNNDNSTVLVSEPHLLKGEKE